MSQILLLGDCPGRILREGSRLGKHAIGCNSLRMTYKDLVHQIADLPWEKASPADLVLLSLGTAKEFASSLREAARLYPEDPRLAEMISGELATDNMQFEDYTTPGDHWQYLDHFVRKYSIEPSSENITNTVREYTTSVETMAPEDRAMTVFSREEELTLIFQKIVDAHDWDALGYGFYRHYLESHILFDSGDGGHHHLTEHFPLHEDVLVRFYEIRLRLYSVLFT